jgi:hypothetical protein
MSRARPSWEVDVSQWQGLFQHTIPINTVDLSAMAELRMPLGSGWNGAVHTSPLIIATTLTRPTGFAWVLSGTIRSIPLCIFVAWESAGGKRLKKTQLNFCRLFPIILSSEIF